MANRHTIAQRKYDKDHCRYFYLKYNTGTDADVIRKLESVPSKQDYIRQLVRNDLTLNPTDKKED